MDETLNNNNRFVSEEQKCADILMELGETMNSGLSAVGLDVQKNTETGEIPGLNTLSTVVKIDKDVAISGAAARKKTWSGTSSSNNGVKKKVVRPSRNDKVCRWCGKGYKFAKNLRRHLERTHKCLEPGNDKYRFDTFGNCLVKKNDSVLRRYICLVCGIGKEEKRQLKRHYRQEHPTVNIEALDQRMVPNQRVVFSANRHQLEIFSRNGTKLFPRIGGIWL